MFLNHNWIASLKLELFDVDVRKLLRNVVRRTLFLCGHLMYVCQQYIARRIAHIDAPNWQKSSHTSFSDVLRVRRTPSSVYDINI